MKNKLQLYFPILRERQEIIEIIHGRNDLSKIFNSWPQKYQEEFLDFCTGVRGVKMLYDAFAKELLNPETVPERLNELLSLIMGTEVNILHVLPNDNSRLADEASLLVMDIVVKLKDGSIANVEIQKIGYSFPGQRCACYSADLLLRQYKQVRSQKTKQTFSYRDIKNVYTIVFFEKSTIEFHNFPDTYLHYFQQKSNTGLELELLQKFLFIPLDIFLKNHHNKVINNRLEAWLTFLGSDRPEDIISVIEAFPDFQAMYEQVYEICRNVEEVMGMFSKELQILDRNTVRYMMDEMQNEIDQQKTELSQITADLCQAKADLCKTETDLHKAEADLRKKETDLHKAETDLHKAETDLLKKDTQLREALKRIAELEQEHL